MKKKINSKQKGDSGERDFINEFKLICNVELKRNRDQTAEGGHDLLIARRSSNIARFIDDRYAIEVKRRGKIKPNDMIRFWEQARKQADEAQRYPLLAYREDYRQWRMLVPIMWHFTQTIDGTADMSLLGACKWIEFEMRQLQDD